MSYTEFMMLFIEFPLGFSLSCFHLVIYNTLLTLPYCYGYLRFKRLFKILDIKVDYKN